MITKRIKITIPKYRERREIFEALGYKEVGYIEKGINAYVTLTIDENEKHYHELRQFEKKLFRKGPPFTPIILLVSIAFTLLSVFVVLFAQQGKEFKLVPNAISFLLPAFLCLFVDVIYTYFYFTINKRIIEEGGYRTKAQILEEIKRIKE